MICSMLEKRKVCPATCFLTHFFNQSGFYMKYNTGLRKWVTLSEKTNSDKILVTSKGFGHFYPTNNFVYFEISKYD